MGVVGLARLRLVAATPGDRRRHPWRPSLVVVEPDLTVAGSRPLHEGFFAGTRRRWATAGSLTWLDDAHLVVAHLLTGTLVLYRFDREGDRPVLRRRARTDADPHLHLPEDIAATPDRRHVAVTNSGTGLLVLLDAEALRDRGAVVVTGRAGAPGDRVPHGVDVSPDGRFVVWSIVDVIGGLRIAAVDALLHAGPEAVVEPLVVADPVQTGKPKGVAFAPDGRHLLLSYAPNVTTGAGLQVPGWIEVRTWNTATGRPGPVVDRLDGVGRNAFEALTFLRDGETVVVTDQAGDTAHVLRFAPATGRLSWVEGVGIGRSRGGLRSPHGCVGTPDGGGVVIACYGDASVRVFDLDDTTGPGRSRLAVGPQRPDRVSTTTS